jgi:hypothetical protein
VIEWPKHSVMPIDGCGFGIVLTSTAMLRKMTPPWFTFEKFSEDFDFCLRAAAAGYQPHVHTDVQCGHLKESEQSTLADFERIKASGELRRFTQRPADSAA